MGSWQETCSLSGLPIYENNACTMVVLDQSVLSEQMFGARTTDFAKIIGIHKGKYDNYGWIQGLDNKDELDVVALFFLKKVWDYVIKEYPTNKDELSVYKLLLNDINRRIEYGELKNFTFLHEFLKITEFAILLRRDIRNSYYFKGCQIFDIKNFNKRRKFLNSMICRGQ